MRKFFMKKSMKSEKDCVKSSINDFVIYNGALIKYTGQEVNVVIPYGVRSIAYCAFADCVDLLSVTIPASVTCIGDAAFSCCFNLEEVIIPNSVVSMGHYVFFGCRNIAIIEIPDSVEMLGMSVFDGWAYIKKYVLNVIKI